VLACGASILVLTLPPCHPRRSVDDVLERYRQGPGAMSHPMIAEAGPAMRKDHPVYLLVGGRLLDPRRY
jgi:hypothetical protein